MVAGDKVGLGKRQGHSSSSNECFEIRICCKNICTALGFQVQQQRVCSDEKEGLVTKTTHDARANHVTQLNDILPK